MSKRTKHVFTREELERAGFEFEAAGREDCVQVLNAGKYDAIGFNVPDSREPVEGNPTAHNITAYGQYEGEWTGNIHDFSGGSEGNQKFLWDMFEKLTKQREADATAAAST
jgi:hypothetical protein